MTGNDWFFRGLRNVAEVRAVSDTPRRVRYVRRLIAHLRKRQGANEHDEAQAIPTQTGGRVRRVHELATDVPVAARGTEEAQAPDIQAGTANQARGHSGVDSTEVLINSARQWLDKAVEAYDDEDYEAVDAASRIAASLLDIADAEMDRERLVMDRERHRQEVVKRRKAMEALAKVEEASSKWTVGP